MPDDAIPHLAKAREINEEALLEERGDWIVEVRRDGERPKPLYDLRGVRSRHEEVGD